MQFGPPPFPPPGYPSYGQPWMLNPPHPNLINCYPNVIGEGNVTSIVSSDGSAQLFFFPITQWPQWRSFPQSPHTGNLNNPYTTSLGAWYVRNVCSPIQPTFFPQPIQDSFIPQYTRTSASDFCLSPPGLPLKFHNDISTSTTDIHYFIPKQFSWFRTPTGCASVQVSCPVATAATGGDLEVSCNKPCNCTPTQPCNCEDRNKKQKVKCKCSRRKKSNSSNSLMSIDSTGSKHRRRKQKSRKSRKKSKRSSHTCDCVHISDSDKSNTKSSSKSSNSRMSIDSTRSNHSPRKSKKMKSKRSRHRCECRQVCGADKSVTTYAEQGICCAPEKGRETQTCCHGVPVIKVSKGACNKTCSQTDVWSKPSCSRHAMTQSTVSFSREKDVSDSGTSCCTSETELE